MNKNLIEISGVLVTKHDEEQYEYTDKEKELCFCFQIIEPDDIAVIVFDDLLPPQQSLSAYGNFFVETLKEGIEATKEITKANVNEFIMWR